MDSLRTMRPSSSVPRVDHRSANWLAAMVVRGLAIKSSRFAGFAYAPNALGFNHQPEADNAPAEIYANPWNRSTRLPRCFALFGYRARRGKSVYRAAAPVMRRAI